MMEQFTCGMCTYWQRCFAILKGPARFPEKINATCVFTRREDISKREQPIRYGYGIPSRNSLKRIIEGPCCGLLLLPLCFRQTEKRLPVPGWDWTLRLWDTSHRKTLVRPLGSIPSLVNTVAFSPDGEDHRECKCRGLIHAYGIGQGDLAPIVVCPYWRTCGTLYRSHRLRSNRRVFTRWKIDCEWRLR